MDDPSITTKLIDVGTDEHEYDEREKLSAGTTNNNNQNKEIQNKKITKTKDEISSTPKLKDLNKKNESKNRSKIPRSPALANSLNKSNSFSYKNTGGEISSFLSNLQQRGKHMNVSDRIPSTPTSPNGNEFSLNGQNVNGNNIMGGGVQITQINKNDNSTANGKNSQRNSTNGAQHRRPQILISPISESQKSFQYLTLTVRKDENGYGMKVSGDNPVYVESVKAGGAAEKAGLVAGDMILKVNGQEVRSEKHPTVVSLIKASTIVELAVKRSHKTIRPSSVNMMPSTPILSTRDRTASITGPQPVDSIKRREMETYKIQTLQKMLEQEKLNLERLNGDPNNPSYKLSEANIHKLREQLRQIGAEDAPSNKLQDTLNFKNTIILSPNSMHHHLSTSSHPHQLHNQATTPQPPSQQSSPAFLSLLPRSLSSLSLGTKRSKMEKEIVSQPQNNLDVNHSNLKNTSLNNSSSSVHPFFNMSQSLHQPNTHFQRSSTQQHLSYQYNSQQNKQKALNAKDKTKFGSQVKGFVEEETPPPLPQRNPPRGLQLDLKAVANSTMIASPPILSPISDLDVTHGQRNSLQLNSKIPQQKQSQSQQLQHQHQYQQQQQNNNKSKRSKSKTKALSDPKMSTQMFLEMESSKNDSFPSESELDSIPPPLPPRQSGLTEEIPKDILRKSNNASPLSRPAPNSIDTLLNYPLVSSCTAVHRDNMPAAFPLSQRPNIVQQLHQHQQQQQQHQQQQQMKSGSVLGQTPPNMTSKHRRVVSSPENLHAKRIERQNKTSSGSWELLEKDGEITPPGTPPPPYLTTHSNLIDMPPHGGGIFVESHQFTPLISTSTHSHSTRIQAAQSPAAQKEIISMEDEDTSDIEGPFIDERAPFNQFQLLIEPENVAFLAVFLNYVLSNSEPSPLLFYLITDLYKEGTAKDMRKWAYEIHSTFLVPGAPLSWNRQDESLAREVDNVLQNEFDKVEILRKVFLKSRKKAKDIICEQLRDFQQKRTAGLGTIYGPTDKQLSEAKGDKQKEQHIFEETLMKKLICLMEEIEKDAQTEDARKLALCSALSTVIHRIFITRSHPNNIVDRVHHFVSREKSFKSRIMGKNRKVIIRGHALVLRQYYEVTHCDHCQNIIWGVSPQGYNCTDCKLNIHRPCSKVLSESCPGPAPQAKRKDVHNDNKISKFMGKIRPRTSSDFISVEKRSRQEEELDNHEFQKERLSSSSIVRQPSDRRTDINSTSIRSNGNNSGILNSSDLQTSLNASGITESISGANSSVTDSSTSTIPLTGPLTGCVNNNTVVEAVLPDLEKNEDAIRERYTHQHNKSAPVSVNRSESYKERLSNKRNRNSRRKTSDPNLSSRPKDEQSDVGLSNSNYLPSSDSSPSPRASYESLSTSTEHVGSAMTPCPNTSIVNHHSHQDSFHGSIGSAGSNNISFWVGNNSIGVPSQLTRQWNFDSDNDDDDLIEVDWSSMVSADILATLTDAEKKRQEIINEIYQTERSHVRTLKLLDRLFFRSLQESGILSQDHLMLLFPPALIPLCDLHGNFEQKLKQRRLEHNHVVNHVGDLLASMFDGPAGDELRELAAQFCARQQIALEALKEKRRKDEQLQKLLNKAESHKACRRLQLKDLLPTVLQRLTKYPLLFENLYKVTVRVLPENTSEADLIQHALESSKKILVDVNQAVKIAEDAHKLQNIQKKLDKSTFDKEEFKNLDLTQHKLIYDGNLTMKKIPGIQLHGLLFENMIVLLTKQDDKYSLKNLQATRNADVNNKPINPIMSIDSETLVRQEAADKNSFFLIKTKTSQMLELRAPSSSDCKTWFKHISEAAEQYKSRSKNVTQESIDDPAIATLPHSNTKDSLELTPDRIPPQTATATVITTPLAPLLSPQSLPSGGSNDDTAVTLQNDMNELSDAKSNHDYYNINNNRLGHNDLLQANSVNRTLSTRSCGDTINNPRNDNSLSTTNVTLRHTQSARQANASTNKDDFHKRDSASIVYSNNSNDTRTLLMQSPLVQPTAIQISINPAHTAEPVLTSAERLRRLDASIKDGLLEKQKIICDMFRVPFEHFDEIVDIASMPEAPKDSADIALAAYDQIQNLTRVINDYMQVSPEQIISAVSTSICDKCNELQNSNTAPSHNLSTFVVSNNQLLNPSASPLPSPLDQSNDLPPPLPPPNKQTSHQLKKQKKQQHQQQHLSQKHEIPMKKILPPIVSVIVDDSQIHEDDDGYCEIDELRLTALPPATISKMENASNTSSPPLPPPSGCFKSLPPPPPPPSINMKKRIPTPEAETSIAEELPIKTEKEEASSENIVKPQSVIIEESIPETLEDSEAPNDKETAFDSENINISFDEVTSKIEDQSQQNDVEIDGNTTNDDKENQILEESQLPTSQEIDSNQIIKEDKKPEEEQVQCSVDHVEDKEERATTIADEVIIPKMVDSSTQTTSSALTLKELKPIQCGPNRLQHVNSLEPQIPCLLVYNICNALNEHISLLLPKLNERDQEREQLRKENQHLRELLNAMHERQRPSQIEENKEKSDEEEKQDDKLEDSNKDDNSYSSVVNIELNTEEHNEMEATE